MEKNLADKKKETDSTDTSLEKNVISVTKEKETLLSHILILKDIVLGKSEYHSIELLQLICFG